MNKRINVFITGSLLLSLLLQPSQAGAVDEVKQRLEVQINQNQMQQDNLEIDLEQLAAENIILSGQITEIDEKIREYDEQLMFLSAKKDEIIEKIDSKDKSINILEEQVDEIKRRREDFKAQLKTRLLAEQESDMETTFLSVLLGSTSFGNFIERTINFKKIYDYDKENVSDLSEVIDELNQSEVEILEEIAILDNYRVTLEELDRYYNTIQEDRKAFMKSLMALADETSQKSKTKEQQLNQLKSKQNKLQQELKEREELLTKYVVPGSSGTFLMPTQGYISSNFGQRWNSMHYGLDIANNTGTSVIASAGGTVKWANYVNRYGNTVLIHHKINGKTYETLYAHLDSTNVKIGQKVKQGQQIGKMGNTGRSFGSHLHFEIHVGSGWNENKSNAKSPMEFLNK